MILDNFEFVINNVDAVRQIGGLIVSADDEFVAKYEIQIILVGVTGNIKQIIASLSNSAPVANRLTEIPEVARMTDTEAKDLVCRGFVDELQFTFDPNVDNAALYSDICFLTDRIAQHIHELCLIVSQIAVRKSGVITIEIFEEAKKSWIEDFLSADIAVIEGVMNARDTKVGRKNQVLYCMGLCKSEDFKYSDIEIILRQNFDVKDATLNVSQILSGFASAKNPIIRRTPKEDAWRFISPKLKMAIRSKMSVTNDGKVIIAN